jgi:hypothetical protein
VFIMTINSGYFSKQQKPTDLFSRDALCFLWGTDLVFKYYLHELHALKGLVNLKYTLMRHFCHFIDEVFIFMRYITRFIGLVVG